MKPSQLEQMQQTMDLLIDLQDKKIKGIKGAHSDTNKSGSIYHTWVLFTENFKRQLEAQKDELEKDLFIFYDVEP